VEFPDAQRRLWSLGVTAVITNAVPPGQTNILGIWWAWLMLPRNSSGSSFQGASWITLPCRRRFRQQGTDEALRLDRRGAAVSSGTVTEPMAKWAKFPCAWTYVHYASGCTAIESLYQGVSCPLQTLFVGEPLACPWAPDASLNLTGLEAIAAAGNVSVKANVASRAARSFVRYMFLLDGRVIPARQESKATQAGNGNTIEIAVSSLADGTHALRAVAYSSGSVRGQVFAEKTFVVKNVK